MTTKRTDVPIASRAVPPTDLEGPLLGLCCFRHERLYAAERFGDAFEELIQRRREATRWGARE